MASHMMGGDGGAPAFVACDGLDLLQHVFGVDGVKVSLQSLLMSLPASSLALAVLYASLSPDQKAAFFASGLGPHFSMHPSFLVGEGLYCLGDHQHIC